MSFVKFVVEYKIHEVDVAVFLGGRGLVLEVCRALDVEAIVAAGKVTDVTDKQWAVPNYLTGRQVNGKITVEL